MIGLSMKQIVHPTLKVLNITGKFPVTLLLLSRQIKIAKQTRRKMEPVSPTWCRNGRASQSPVHLKYLNGGTISI